MCNKVKERCGVNSYIVREERKQHPFKTLAPLLGESDRMGSIAIKFLPTGGHYV
jgi:hypothetical protein